VKHPKSAVGKKPAAADTPEIETPAPPEPRSISRGLELALVAGALLVFLVLAVTSARRKSSTFDEGAHIPAAYTYVALGDFRMNPEHPPLVKLLAGLPLRFLHPKMDTEDPDWKAGKQWEFAMKFLYEWNDADRLIFWARVPVMLLTMLIGLVVWHCARTFYGWKAGYGALVLFLLNPDVLAHGQLVTTDLAVAGGLFTSAYCFYRALQRVTLLRVVLLGLAVGLTVIAKFSGVLVFPALLLVGVAYAFANASTTLALPKAAERVIKERNGKLVVTCGLLAASLVFALVIIWGCYGFRNAYSPDPAVAKAINWEHYWQKETLMTSLIQFGHKLHIVPEGYSYGFLYVLESVEKRLAYLAGEYSSNGWWFYFIVTFLIKTPLSLLILIGLAWYFFKRYQTDFTAEAMLLLPAALYWLVTLTSHLNIGHRHLLPIYPFLIVFAAKVLRVFDLPMPATRRLAITCGVLLGWYVIGAAVVYPNYLTYFNEAAGGPGQGYRWLADSSIDWGQDLKGLAEYRRAHPDEPFYLSYFGSAIPEYYGLNAQFLAGFNSQMAEKQKRRELVNFGDVPSGATVAISVTNLTGVYLRGYRLPGTDQFLQRLRQLTPVAKIGNSIFVYRLP
jgi:hypothetical protein